MSFAFTAARSEVYNRGRASMEFLNFLVNWARDAPDSLFALNESEDVYSHVKYKFGPWMTGSDFLIHRRAVMCEVLRTLCGFESSWKWEEGIDLSANGGRSRDRHIREWEAGILQASSNSMYSYRTCRIYAAEFGIGISDHEAFRELSMTKGAFPIQYGATILRETYRHHGPLLRTENDTADPQSSSIHPYLSVEATKEFEHVLGSGPIDFPVAT